MLENALETGDTDDDAGASGPDENTEVRSGFCWTGVGEPDVKLGSRPDDGGARPPNSGESFCKGKYNV